MDEVTAEVEYHFHEEFDSPPPIPITPIVISLPAEPRKVKDSLGRHWANTGSPGFIQPDGKVGCNNWVIVTCEHCGSYFQDRAYPWSHVLALYGPVEVLEY